MLPFSRKKCTVMNEFVIYILILPVYQSMLYNIGKSIEGAFFKVHSKRMSILRRMFHDDNFILTKKTIALSVDQE